jgi:integrase
VSGDVNNLLEAVELQLRSRRFGEMTRVEVSSTMSDALCERIRSGLHVGGELVYPVDGRLDLSGVSELIELDRPDLKIDPWLPIARPLGREHRDQFAAIRCAPRLVHHPYDSFAASYEAFVEASADDPDVLAIKSTVYWTGEDAPPVVERAVLEPADVERVAGEMRPPYDAAVLVGAWCYLRPGELLGLERGDVGSGVLNVRGTKTARSRRTVPVPMRAARALSELPVRFGTRLLFPSPQGMPFDACRWRHREFNWAREAAGLSSDVTPYTLRHSGISWALHAGIPASDVARFAGTSVTMLETRYHHLLATSAEAARARLDAFAASSHNQ